MENLRQEEDFIIVVSKRERRRLQQLKAQKQEKQQEQKNQEEQLQQQKQDKQQQKKQEKSQELERHQKKNQNKQQQKPQGLERQQEQKKQEEQKKLEKQQQKPKNQQQLKKKRPQEKPQQPNKQQHDNLLQQEIITPTNNDITATLTKLPKTVLLNEQPACQSCQLNDKKSEVNVTKELLCIKNESLIKSFLADCDKELNAERDVQLDEMQNLENLTASQGTQGFPNMVVEASRIKNHCSTTDFDKDNKKLEHLEIENATKDIHENEKRCKKHDTMIKDLREENQNMRAQYELSMKNNWSDGEFKIVLEGVRAEIEMKRLNAIKKLVDDHQVMLEQLKMEHDAEVNGLHIYYQSVLNNIQMNHNMMVGAIHMKHEKIIENLKNINYDQGQRYETAIQSMRQDKVKIGKEHQTELRALREKYDSMSKDHEIAMSYLIEEKELFRAEHEKIVQEMSEKNEDQHRTTIKTVSTLNGLNTIL